MTTPPAWRLSVAPMLDWTDSACRQFHRRLSRHALLYTEMVTSAALVRGGALHLLRFDPAEQPVALQLGGSDPAELAEATRLGADAGYSEINLNVGCPSDRVQSGCFGAVLMNTPGLVGECLAAMRAASAVEVTVKCRIGVDDQNPEEALPALLQAAREAGIRRVTVHARKAWLQGLSPKENREVPPLDYDLVARMIPEFPDLTICVNGGIGTLDEARALLARGFAGVMIGRAAYHRPAEILGPADRLIYGDTAPEADPLEVAAGMEDVIAAHLQRGGRLIGVTRHLLGLFAGQPGARHWRRALSEMPNGTLSDYRALVAGLMERQAA
ncbi:tRNA dihydrouridine(20/20a) synthase DusA [Pararhodobacter aggregans]|uniref:tRNA-dihydrouridine(20/20a) synthase n=2 Tax=Pararhodobacter aggregans TaxID=404875 RepID=A0A2T7UQZ7_9RHOB|nr:tRNA dihydrouridine(20/20a) synthase DusA [Pararhodobacter aggregans]PVE47107.1 tRNA dihydrouridine(20/20a) synthase DusA [Pararhodobacter aggregans]